MTRRALERGKRYTYREVHAALSRADNLAEVRNGGRHTFYQGENGYGVAVPNHNGDVPTGTLGSILKQAAIAGLLLAPFVCMAFFYLTHFA